MFGLWQAKFVCRLAQLAQAVHPDRSRADAWVCGSWHSQYRKQLDDWSCGDGLETGAWVPLVVAFSALFSPKEAVKASALLTLFNSIRRVLATSVTEALDNLGGYSLLLCRDWHCRSVHHHHGNRQRIRRSPARPSVGGMVASSCDVMCSFPR